MSIAGSDPSGGAGIQADLKTFHRFGVYGEAVLTLVTAQNTTRVSRVVVLEPEFVLEQLNLVLEDIPPAAAKTGALGTEAMVRAIAGVAAGLTFPLVVDPVMIGKHGAPLMDPGAIAAVRDELMPACSLITPNAPEAAALTGRPVESLDDARRAAMDLRRMGARAVLVKGGHLDGDAVDVLFDGSEWTEFRAPRIATRHTHGTGCTYSAAIAAGLAKGRPLRQAVADAKAFVSAAIAGAPGLGKGYGPVDHWAWPRDTLAED